MNQHGQMKQIGYFWLGVVAVASFSLCLPYIKVNLWLGDEGVLLHGAMRILRGERLYSDFFEFLPPGGFAITTGWVKITGVSMLSARLLAILTITGIACFTFLACSLTTNKSAFSAFIAIAWIVMTQGLWTVLNHHWFTTLFSMITVWASLKYIKNQLPIVRYPIIAGLSAGVAAMTTPTAGALAMLAGTVPYIARRQWRHFIYYSLASLTVPIIIFSYLFYQGSLVDFFYDSIVFMATQYSSIQGVPFANGS